MKKYGFLMLAAVVALSLALSAASAMAADKIAFVHFQAALINSEAGKIAAGQLSKVIEKDKATLQAREKELQKLKDELEKQKQVLKEDAFRAKEADYQKKLRDYQLMVRDANEEVEAKRQEVFKPLAPVMGKVIHDIGEREKYTMIVDVSVIPLIFYDKKMDITQKATEEFNKAYKAKK
jgi:outer membrane protein